MSANRQARVGRRWGEFKPSQWGQFSPSFSAAIRQEEAQLELRVTDELAEQPLDRLRGGTAVAQVLKKLGDLALSAVAG